MMRRPSNRVSQVSTRGDSHPQMAACFQVILTWSSLTTAKLFPPFFPPSLSLFFFVQGCSKTASERKQKTMAGSYGAFRSKSGQVFKFRIDRLWKRLREKGRRESEGRREGRVRESSSGRICI